MYAFGLNPNDRKKRTLFFKVSTTSRAWKQNQFPVLIPKMHAVSKRDLAWPSGGIVLTN